MDNIQNNSQSKEYIAALDLGTTTCRLLIAEVTPQGPHVVDSFVRIIRLGEGLATEGRISQAALSRALAALTVCARKLKGYKIKKIRCVATAACRQAANREEFLETILLKTGLELEVISTKEESRLAIMGCADLLDASTRYAIGFDIGGGSTEVMWMELFPDKLPEIIECVSLPVGVVTLGEALQKLPAPYPFLRKIRKEVANDIKAFSDKSMISPHVRKKNVQLIATSGTLTTLAALHIKLDRYDRKKVNGLLLSSTILRATIANLYGMTRGERLLQPCIGPTRADLVLGGVAIFEGIYDVFPIDPVRVADRGVREGLLRDLLDS